MKIIMKSVLVAGVTVLAATTMLASGGGGQPVHNIRLTYKVAFTNSGAQPTASGSAIASESINNNGNKGSDKETLTLSFKGLQSSDTYSVLASGNFDGTNFVDDDVLDFSPNKSGAAKFTLKNTGTTKHPATLPELLDPLSGVTELDVVDDGDFTAGTTNTPPITILTADTTTPQTFTFSDRQTITASSSTNGVTGTLVVSASNKSSKLSLTAAGLQDSTPYVLSLNSTPTTNNTFTSTSKGTLKISAPVSQPVLDLTDVDLDDTGGNTVLFFPMP